MLVNLIFVCVGGNQNEWSFPGSSHGKRICLQCRRSRFDPWVGKIPWRKERLPIPVFWPGEFHGLYSPWGRQELDTTERLNWTELMYGLTEILLLIGTSAIWGWFPVFTSLISSGLPAHHLWWLQLLMTETSFVYWYVRRDLGLIPGFGRSPGGRYGNPP